MSPALAIGATGKGWTITGAQGNDRWVIACDDFTSGPVALTVRDTADRLGVAVPSVPSEPDERREWVWSNSPGALAIDEGDAFAEVGARHRAARGVTGAGLRSRASTRPR